MLTDTLAALGLPGQAVAWIVAAITIATALVKVLPTPAAGDTGIYPKLWDAISWAANLGKPIVKS